MSIPLEDVTNPIATLEILGLLAFPFITCICFYAIFNWIGFFYSPSLNANSNVHWAVARQALCCIPLWHHHPVVWGLITAIPPIWSGPSPQCTNSLLDWAIRNGAIFTSVIPTIFIQNSDDLLCQGLVCSRPVKPQETVLSIPHTVCMSLISARQSRLAAVISETPLLQTGGEVCLALHLWFEKFVEYHNSIWYPFIAALPLETPSILITWSEAKVVAIGIPRLLERWRILNNAFHSLYSEFILPLFCTYPHILDPICLTKESFLWALACVRSRAFMMPCANEWLDLNTNMNPIQNNYIGEYLKVCESNVPPGYIPCLVPIADLANHSFHGGTACFSHNGDSFCLRSPNCPISSGDQFCVNYGDFSNEDLLVSYGFCVERNPHDCIPLTFHIRDATPKFESKFRFLLNETVLFPNGLASAITFEIYGDAIPIALMIILRCLVLDEDDLCLSTNSMSENTNNIRKILLGGYCLSVPNERRALLFLKSKLHNLQEHCDENSLNGISSKVEYLCASFLRRGYIDVINRTLSIIDYSISTPTTLSISEKCQTKAIVIDHCRSEVEAFLVRISAAGWLPLLSLLLKEISCVPGVVSILVASCGQWTTSSKTSVLHLVAKSGHIECVSLLIESKWWCNVDVADMCARGCDIECRSLVDGTTPLHCAAASGSLQVVKCLLSLGADVNCVTRRPVCCSTFPGSQETQFIEGLTPLHYACTKGYVSIVSTLINAGCNLNVQGHNGITPLHIACIAGYVEIADVLIQRGARTDLKAVYSGTGFVDEDDDPCNYVCTPIKAAILSQQSGIILLMKKHGIPTD